MDAYPSNSRHSSASPTNSRGSSVKSSGPSRSSIDHQNLLAPVVRSKRTPIACTECRRRQVKCTGTTPKCERCEKRGMKCEYIPCSQQKATSNESPPPQPIPNSSMHPNQHARQYSFDQYTQPQWQQSSRSLSVPYDSTSYSQYSQHVEWQRHQGQSADMLQQTQYSPQGIPVQTYTGSAYSQSSYSHAQQPYSAPTGRTEAPYAQRPIIPSQHSYAGMSAHGGFIPSDVAMENSGLSYSYENVGQPMGNQYIVPSTSNLSGEYYHAETDTFDPRATGLVSHDSLSHPYNDVQNTNAGYQYR